MTREEIANSQDYKATKAALEWWYSLPEEQRKATDINAEPDIVDAYSEGVIYGWNNPQWIPVEKELPKKDGKYLFYDEVLGHEVSIYYDGVTLMPSITHWMSLPQPPQGKEE